MFSSASVITKVAGITATGTATIIAVTVTAGTDEAVGMTTMVIMVADMDATRENYFPGGKTA